MRKIVFFVLLGICLLAQDAQAKATCQTKQVVMFMTDWCPYCRTATIFFGKHGVDFRSIDVEKAGDPADIDIRRLFRGARGVPYILAEDKKIDGYNEQILRGILCIVDE